VEIEYCRRCGFLLRAGWLAQELLATFAEDLREVALVPGDGGVFEVRVDGVPVWSRATDGGFPEPTVVKRAVRDVVAPGRSLGHSDG
jgi:selenoprotein W-related protein